MSYCHTLPTRVSQGEGGLYKGWNSQLAQWGAIIPTVQRAPGNSECIYNVRGTNTLCDRISIQTVL